MQEITFRVQGSAAEPYEVRFVKRSQTKLFRLLYLPCR
jgi:hypothetical protein